MSRTYSTVLAVHEIVLTFVIPRTPALSRVSSCSRLSVGVAPRRASPLTATGQRTQRASRLERRQWSNEAEPEARLSLVSVRCAVPS